MPMANDAVAIYELVKASKPLDLNSKYAYILVCTHFAQTSIIAELNGEVVGFVSGYRIPDLSQEISIHFVWQVAVDEKVRANGIALEMLKRLFKREGLQNITHIDTTISPSNTASQNLFISFAKTLGTPIQTQKLFDQSLFGKDAHEDEDLYRIGPMYTIGE